MRQAEPAPDETQKPSATSIPRLAREHREAAYHKGLEEVGEDLGGKFFVADSAVNPLTNASWKAYTKQPHFLRRIAELQIPAVFINASDDIRPNWPTEQLAHLLPNGRYVEIEGAAHTIWLTHAEELKAHLIEAIESITEATR